MTYVEDWKRQSDVLKRAVATGVPEGRAKCDICRAIADGKIKLRIRFVSPGKFFPHEVHYVKPDEIPARLKPSHFDWSQSRVRIPWQKVRTPSGSFLGHWQLVESTHYRRDDALPQSFTRPSGRATVPEWHAVELFKPDVTEVLITTRATQHSSPALERAQRAIKAVYGDDLPDQATEPNMRLCKRVGAMLKDKNWPDVSNDTILRAAGRRK